MKGRIAIITLIFVTALGLVFLLNGCEIFITVKPQPKGKVVDGRSGQGVAGATVKLVYATEEATTKEKEKISETGYYTAITTTSGEFDFANEEIDSVPYGDYTLTAEKSGYVFFDRKVSVSSLRPDLGTLMGVTAEEGLSLILFWNDQFHDVDAYLSYPKKDAATTGGTAPTFESPYDDGSPEGTAGFSPERYAELTSNPYTLEQEPKEYERQLVYWGSPSTAADSSSTFNSSTYENTLDLGTPDLDLNEDGTAETYYISLDHDETLGGGPEAITIRGFPFENYETSKNESTTGGGATGLPVNTDGYTWVGVMEYYVNAFDSDWTNTANDTSQDYLSEAETGNSADALLYLVEGTKDSATIKGKYTVPSYTKVKSASLLRINCFYKHVGSTEYEFYQIVPDIRVLQSTAEVKSVEDAIITVEKKSRRR